MALTPAQDVTLKANILTGPNAPALAAFVTGEDWYSVAAYYNQPSGSTVWRPNIPASELKNAIVGSAFDALSVQKQGGYAALVSGNAIDATVPSIRSWFQDIFGAGVTLTALTAIAQRPATRFEMLFATASAPSNLTQVFGQLLTPDDVQHAMIAGA